MVTCETDDAIEPFVPPRHLAILGQPKPQQGRFYLGKADGTAQVAGLSKEQAGYSGDNRIRGPKVYPHHRQFRETNWEGDKPNKQNRSITGWIKPGTEFVFDLHVENLTRIELGGLVWLLSLSEDHFLRMGLGKPLGFGSVRAEIVPEGTLYRRRKRLDNHPAGMELLRSNPLRPHVDEGGVRDRDHESKPQTVEIVPTSSRGFRGNTRQLSSDPGSTGSGRGALRMVRQKRWWSATTSA